MSDFNKVLALAGALLFVGVVIFVAARPRPLQAIHGTDLRSDRQVELEDYRGDVVLVQFFATWCGPCMQEYPNIRRMYDRYEADGFRVIAVSLDQQESKLREWVEAQNIPYPVIFREGMSIARYHNVRFIPRGILVGRDGTVLDDNVRGHLLEDAIVKALSAPS